MIEFIFHYDGCDTTKSSKEKKNHLKGKKNDASQKYLTLYFNYKIQKFTFYL